VKIVFFSISFEKGNRFDYSIHNIFADSYNLCAHEELIRPNEGSFIKTKPPNQEAMNALVFIASSKHSITSFN
jgi:hypothetical protein